MCVCLRERENLHPISKDDKHLRDFLEDGVIKLENHTQN